MNKTIQNRVHRIEKKDKKLTTRIVECAFLGWGKEKHTAIEELAQALDLQVEIEAKEDAIELNNGRNKIVITANHDPQMCGELIAMTLFGIPYSSYLPDLQSSLRAKARKKNPREEDK